MMLYHGSDWEIPVPDLLHFRVNVSFGRGFNTAPFRKQAVKWCSKFKRQGKPRILSRYSFDETAYMQLKVLRFSAYDEAWLEFVLTCRSGKDCSDYALVLGGVANDKVSDFISQILKTRFC